MFDAHNKKPTRVVSVLVVFVAVGYALYAGLATDARSTGVAANAPSRTLRGPGGISEMPFTDARVVASVDKARPELPFRPSAPFSLGTPEAVYVHEDYRPQALGLIYRSASLGHFIVTQEPVAMPHNEQVAGLQQLAANCNPATGCQGSWTMANIGNGNPALIISNPPDGVNAVIWIHGTTRFQLFGATTEFTSDNALTAASALEAGA